MLARDPPTDHHHHSWSANYYSHTANTTDSFHAMSQNPMSQSACTSPRSPSFQSWKTSRLPGSPSFVPSTAPPEQSEHASSQMRRPPAENGLRPLSPFRSVRRMKKPFELMLPTSPRSSEKEPALSPPPSRQRALRPWRSDQNIAATRLEAGGLLPSPPLSESSLSNPSPASAFFFPKGEPDLKDGNEAVDCDDKSEDTQCEFPLAPGEESFVDDGYSTGEVIDVHMADPTFPKHLESNEIHCPSGPTNAEHVFATTSPLIGVNEERSLPGPPPPTARETAVCSDASRIPNNMAYFENWLQGVPAETMDVHADNSIANRRKCQIVQKVPPPFEEASGEPVTFAVASKTKPKLVDISPKSSPPMGFSDAGQSPKHPATCMPEQHQQEISAFSPDTTNEVVDNGYDMHYSFYSPGRDDREDEYIDTGSMHSDSMSSTAVCEQSVLSNDSLERPCSPAKPDISPTTNVPLPKPQPSPGGSSMSEREQLEKWWDHEWTLDQLEHSVKDFPSNMLRLTSPVVMFLRQSSEQALLRPFRQIFPAMSENLLDSLCASLIARNYVVSLSSTQKSTAFLSGASCGFSFVPDKALTTLGIQVPYASPTHIKDRVFGSRSAELRRNLDRIVDYLLFAICGRSDETLKSAVLVVAQVLETKA